MKKFVSLFLSIIFASTLFATPVLAAGYELGEGITLHSQASYLVNLDTGLVIYEQNPNEKRSIASLTKLMTVLLLLENVPDLENTQVTANVAVYVSPVTDPSSSSSNILPGEIVSAKTLLYAMLLASGNEAAAVTAYHLGGGVMENFYAMMNARAAELGCVDTHFVDSNGLSDMAAGNYSTAHDVMQIAKACWQYEAFKTAATATSYDMPLTNKHPTPEFDSKPNAAYTIYTTVKPQIDTASVYRSYIRGIKTGSTMDAGRNFTSCAVNKAGETYMAVVLGCPWDTLDENGFALSFTDTNALYDWTFANFALKPTLDVTVPITESKVTLSSETDTVQLYPAADLKTILPNTNSNGLVTMEYDVPETLEAPLMRGEVLGSVTVSLMGEVIGQSDLLAGADITRNGVLFAMDRMGKFFQNTFFKVLFIVASVYILICVALMLWFHSEQKKKRARREKFEQRRMK